MNEKFRLLSLTRFNKCVIHLCQQIVLLPLLMLFYLYSIVILMKLDRPVSMPLLKTIMICIAITFFLLFPQLVKHSSFYEICSLTVQLYLYSPNGKPNRGSLKCFISLHTFLSYQIHSIYLLLRELHKGHRVAQIPLNSFQWDFVTLTFRITLLFHYISRGRTKSASLPTEGGNFKNPAREAWLVIG